MKLKITETAMKDLIAFTSDEGQVKVNKDGSVYVQYKDGINIVKPLGDSWTFAGSNSLYEAGYAYACGYRD